MITRKKKIASVWTETEMHSQIGFEATGMKDSGSLFCMYRQEGLN